MRVLIGLLLRRLKNRAVKILKKSREPKYALGMFLAALYFASLLFVPRGPGAPMGYLADTLTVFLAFSHFRGWIPYPKSPRGPWLFGLREIQLLFPAPLGRGELLAYAVLERMGMSLIFGLFFFFLSGMRVEALVGFSLYTTIATLHSLVTTYFRKSLREAPLRSLLYCSPGILYSLSLAVAFGLCWRPVAPETGAFEHLIEIFETPGLFEISYPIRAPARLIMGMDMPWSALVCLAEIGIYALWLYRLDFHYEEWAVQNAARGGPKRDTDEAPRPASGEDLRPALLRGLSWRGGVVISFAHMRLRDKDAPRSRRGRWFMLGVLALGAAAPGLPETWRIWLVEALPTMIQLLAFAVLFWRRHEAVALDAMELLKPLPLAGWRVILGDIVGGAAASLRPLAGLLALAVALTPQDTFQPWPLELRVGLAALVLVALAAISLGLQAIFYLQALMFPGLSRLRQDQEGGIGHNMLVSLTRTLFVLGMLLVPAVAATIGYGMAIAVFRSTSPGWPVAAASVAHILQVAAAIAYAGHLFDHSDFVLGPVQKKDA